MEDPRLLVTTELADTTWLRILDIARVLGGRSTLAAGRLHGTPAALDELDRLLAWPRPAWSSHMF